MHMKIFGYPVIITEAAKEPVFTTHESFERNLLSRLLHGKTCDVYETTEWVPGWFFITKDKLVAHPDVVDTIKEMDSEESQ